MHIDEEYLEVGPDCAVYIPPQALQYIENTGNTDLKFLCIVDPAWREEDESRPSTGLDEEVSDRT